MASIWMLRISTSPSTIRMQACSNPKTAPPRCAKWCTRYCAHACSRATVRSPTSLIGRVCRLLIVDSPSITLPCCNTSCRSACIAGFTNNVLSRSLWTSCAPASQMHYQSMRGTCAVVDWISTLGEPRQACLDQEWGGQRGNKFTALPRVEKISIERIYPLAQQGITGLGRPALGRSALEKQTRQPQGCGLPCDQCKWRSRHRR